MLLLFHPVESNCGRSEVEPNLTAYYFHSTYLQKNLQESEKKAKEKASAKADA